MVDLALVGLMARWNRCDLDVADDWFASHMRRILQGPDWRSGHFAVVLTADEDDETQDKRVLTVVVHPSQRGRVVSERLDHYSLALLLAEVAHARPPFEAASAASMSNAFKLEIR